MERTDTHDTDQPSGPWLIVLAGGQTFVGSLRQLAGAQAGC